MEIKPDQNWIDKIGLMIVMFMIIESKEQQFIISHYLYGVKLIIIIKLCSIPFVNDHCNSDY